MSTSAPSSNGREEHSRAYQLGCDISAWVSDFAAHPYVQLAVVIICIGWFAIGLSTDLLTAALSILAISLSQMVLNRQNEREIEAHRRDVAMHAKLDELIISVRRAHNEMAGIEDLPEEVIVELREENLQHLTDATDEVDEAHRGMPGDATKSRRRANNP